jgi:Holliday junction resolvasome RuvABC endonuclease subunit
VRLAGDMSAPLKPASHAYLGIDPGAKNCALVAFNPNRGVVLTWKPGKDIPAGVRRLSYLIHHIKQQLGVISDDGGNIVRIAMEHYSMFEKFGQHAAGEVGGAIKLALVGWFGLDNPIGYPILVSPQQLKKFAIGSGNAKKSMMVKEVLKRWGQDFNDENLAEAYALARVAHAQASEPAMPAFQLEVIKALAGRTEWQPSWSELTNEDGIAGPKMNTDSSSSSAEPATLPPLRRLSRGQPKKASGSDSGPSEPLRLTRLLKPQPSRSSS